MFQNLFGSIRTLVPRIYGNFRNTVSRIGQGLQTASQKIGGFKNLLSSGYNIARNLPILSDFLQPYQEQIQHGLNAVEAGGNLLGSLGRGEFGNAANEAYHGVNEALGGGNALRDYIWERGRAPPGGVAGHFEPGVNGGLPRLVPNRRPGGPGPVILPGRGIGPIVDGMAQRPRMSAEDVGRLQRALGGIRPAVMPRGPGFEGVMS